jgi:hypothetical protein
MLISINQASNFFTHKVLVAQTEERCKFTKYLGSTQWQIFSSNDNL